MKKKIMLVNKSYSYEKKFKYSPISVFWKEKKTIATVWKISLTYNVKKIYIKIAMNVLGKNNIALSW